MIRLRINDAGTPETWQDGGKVEPATGLVDPAATYSHNRMHRGGGCVQNILYICLKLILFVISQYILYVSVRCTVGGFLSALFIYVLSFTILQPQDGKK